MHSFIAGTRNEWSKLAARKKLLFSLLLLVLLPVASAVLLSQLQAGIGIAAVSSGDFPVLMLSIYTGFVIPLFTFMAAADLFAGEIQDRTLKLTLLRPISRFVVFSSKVAALGLYSLVSLVVGCAVSVLAGLLLNSQSGWGTGLLQSLEAYSVAFVPMFTLVVLAVLLTQLFRSASGAMMVCVFVYAALKLLGVFYPQYAAYSPTYYTDWHQLWLNGAVPASKIINATTYLAASCILCFTAAFAMFDRREI
ncbi:ABC transporter permease [Paenibacillus radicis (ex Xue et al. 2023)]|uniref:ABC transporter permease n=1 Tax=Paenibacillus radicis (ex Xue et al. 2023) TaxID=2972489 RepID=A0ABT1YMZ5_9BACL|nr:ABC transporter permease [Paenibacillus radicis (ex Xue et al. 2023)]MCR8634549.1 ABC transporter permease [Paenibacillus radicis (ex Xue et al. 2023)]